MLPLITGALGIGGGEGGGETAGGGGDGDPLLEEIKGLRQDIQAQPIQIVFDNKVVSEITKKYNEDRVEVHNVITRFKIKSF